MKIWLLKLMTPSGSVSSTSRTRGGTPSGYITRMPEHIPGNIKQDYTISDLPLPLADGGAYIEKWHKDFVPSLLTWAGAHEDPFRVRSELFTAVPHIWERVFCDVRLHNNDLVTLVKVVSCME